MAGLGLGAEEGEEKGEGGVDGEEALCLAVVVMVLEGGGGVLLLAVERYLEVVDFDLFLEELYIVLLCHGVFCVFLCI